MDRYEEMRVFAAVVEAGGFTRAVERIGVSRAAISKHVLQLEARLGTRLLQRTTRRVSPTEAGRLFYEQCRRILDDIAGAEAVAFRGAATPQGELRVVAPTNFGLAYLGSAITDFLAAHPGLRIDLSLSDRPVDPIESGHDLAIRVVPAELPSFASLAACRLSTSRRILCASPDYLAARGTPAHPRDLTSHECLSYSYIDEPRRWCLRGADGEHVVPVSGRILTSAGQLLRAAAVRHFGIAYGPTVFFRDDLDAGRLVHVLADYELPQVSIFSLYPASRYPSLKVAAFNDFMQRFFEGKFV
jgi:DNA-binding transcriptional LysR family regulator